MIGRHLVAVVGLGLVLSTTSWADDGQQDRELTLADVLLESVGIVFDKHVDPPTRGELLRRGIKGMYLQARVSQPKSLGRRISELAVEKHAGFLREAVRTAQATGASDEHLQTAFLSSLLNERRVEASTSRYVPAKEYRVQKQIRDNRYVGIGIQLSLTNGRPTMAKVLPGGPAVKGGGRDGDMIMSIDGTDTEDMNLREAVDLLRGRAGEPVTIVVSQPNETEARTLDLVRGEVPFETVVGTVREADGWRHDIEPDRKIAYVRITSVRGSTVPELREAARRIRDSGFTAIMLDLRLMQDGDLRHAIMLADELIGEAPLGSYVDARGSHELTSNAQSLFADLPLAVLVDTRMQGEACWVAAALQDSQRGALVGVATPVSEWYANEFVELPAGAGGILLPSAILLRPNVESEPGRLMIEWKSAVGFDGSRFTQTEHKMADWQEQPGADKRLLPDHFVRAPRSRGGGPVRAALEADPQVQVAIRVLRQQIELARAD